MWDEEDETPESSDVGTDWDSTYGEETSSEDTGDSEDD